jgi:hypothetical protein
MNGPASDTLKTFHITTAPGKSSLSSAAKKAQLTNISRPGDKNMKAVGAVYVNATLTLLNQGPSSGTMFWGLCVAFPFPLSQASEYAPNNLTAATIQT